MNNTFGFKYLGVSNLFVKSALSLAIATASSSWAYAEELKQLPTVNVDATAEGDYKVNNSTSHKQTQPLLDTARTISVIPKSVMQDRGVENLRDALRNVPGISLAAGEGGTPTGDSLSIRGFSARTDILIDGVRDIAGYTRDVYNLEAVEVSKGPSSVLNGRGSTGGSINLQTKTATLDEISDVGFSAGSENDYRISVDANRLLGDQTALRINLLTDDGGVAGRDEVENSKDAVAVSFATGLETNYRFTVNAEYQKQDNLPDYGLPWVSNGSTPVAELASHVGGPPPADYSNFYGNLYRDFEDIDAKSLSAKYEYDISTNTVLRVQTRIGSVERLSIVSAPRFIDIENTTDVRLSDEKTRDTKNSLGVMQFDVIGKYRLNGITHDVVGGVEIAKEKERRWNYDDNGTDNLDTTPEVVDLYQPNSRVAYDGHYRRLGGSTEAIGDTRAIYIFDTMTFNPQWELTLGGRWESFETNYQYDFVDPSLTLKANDKLFSWSTSIVYKPALNGSIYFGVGNSLNPSAEDLTASTLGNANELDPEETLSYELGTKWELLDGKIFANAAIFRTTKTNARTDDPFAVDTRAEILNGEQRVDGVELSAVGQLNNDFSLTAGYTYQHSEVLKASGDDDVQQGNQLSQTPKHSASVWGNYQMSERWTAGLGIQYIGERYNNSSSISRESAEGYATIDMMVGFDLSKQLHVQFNGTNLADKDYEDQLGGGHFIPGEGRHVQLGINYSF